MLGPLIGCTKIQTNLPRLLAKPLPPDAIVMADGKLYHSGIVIYPYSCEQITYIGHARIGWCNKVYACIWPN
jgi:hypothetical protein